MRWSASKPREALPAGRSRPSAPRRASRNSGKQTFALAPARHRQALSPAVLLIDQRARLACAIGGIEPLRNHSPKALLRGRGKPVLCPPDEAVRRSPRRPLQIQARQQLPTGRVRQLPRSAAIEDFRKQARVRQRFVFVAVPYLMF